MRLEVLLGNDAVDRRVTVDLCSMPHLLVAGMTGSGKSVWLNSMILDLITYTPDQVQLLLIEPHRPGRDRSGTARG